MARKSTYRQTVPIALLAAGCLSMAGTAHAQPDQGNTRPVQLIYGGYHKMHFETANRQHFGSEHPLTLFRWELQPTVSAYGIPLSMSLFYTTEDNNPGGNASRFQFGLSLSSDLLEQTLRDRLQNEMHQSTRELMDLEPSLATEADRAQISDRVDQLADLQHNLDVSSRRLDQLQNLGLLSSTERLAMRFPMLGIGAAYPHYSRFVMQGITVSGFHLEVLPGRAFLGTNIGNVRNPAGAPGFSRLGVFENDRKVYAGRVGYGRPFGRHVHLMGVYVDESAEDPLRENMSGQGPHPQMKNFITGIKFRMGAIRDHLDLQGELAASFLTRDADAPKWANGDLADIPVLSPLIDPNLSSSADVSGMVDAALRLPGPGTRLRAGMQYVGPGYINLASPALRNDMIEQMGGIEQAFMRRQVTVSANFRTERNNIDNLKSFTRTSTRYDFQLALNFRDLPWVRLQYIPVIQKNRAQDLPAGTPGEYTYNTRIVNVISGYSVPIGKVMSTSTVNMSGQFISTDLMNADATSLLIGLNQHVAFGNAAVHGGYQRFSFTRMQSTSVRNDFTLGGSLRILGMWMHETGLRNSSGQNQVSVTGLWYRSSIPIRYLGVFEVMIDQSWFSGSMFTDGTFNQIQFTASLTRSW
jgi:hypothetical protein